MNAVHRHRLGTPRAALDVEALRARLPVLAPTGPRQAARLPRQRGLQPEAERGDRRGLALLRRRTHANVHRGVHYAQPAGDRRLRGRAARSVRRFLNAPATREIVFIRGTTEAINLVAQSCGRPAARPGDEILITAMEHHANIVPWQMLCEQTGRDAARGRRSTTRGELDPRRIPRAARPPRTQPRRAHRTSRTRSAPSTRCRDHRRARTPRGIPVLIDGAQAVPAHARSTCRRSTATSTPSRATSCTARPGIGVLYGREVAARGDAALAGRRRHDPARSPSSARPTTTCPTSSRPARRTSPAPSASAPRSTTSSALGIERDRARTSRRCSPTRPSALTAIPGLRIVGTARAQGRRRLVHARRRASARPRHDPRQRGRRGPRRPPLRAAADGALRRAGDRPRLVRASTTRGGDRPAGGRAGQRAGALRLMDLKRPLPRRDPGSQREAAATSAPMPDATPRRRPQPALRRPPHACTLQARRRAHRATSVSRARAARSPRPRPR